MLSIEGGASDGFVYLWDIDVPTLPMYNGVFPRLLLRLNPSGGEVSCVVWTGNNHWLMASTRKKGLVAWNIDDDNVLAAYSKQRVQLQKRSDEYK